MRAIVIILASALGACATEPTVASPPLPETVSVQVSSTSDADAQRLCGGPAHPETVHHESNVVTYRCLRGAS